MHKNYLGGNVRAEEKKKNRKKTDLTTTTTTTAIAGSLTGVTFMHYLFETTVPYD